MAKGSKSAVPTQTAAVQTNDITTGTTAAKKRYTTLTKGRNAAGDSNLRPMDDKLQQAILLHRSGIRKSPTSSTSEDELAVIASVTNKKPVRKKRKAAL